MAAMFTGQAMYTFKGSQILHREGDRFVPIGHSAVYPDPSAD